MLRSEVDVLRAMPLESLASRLQRLFSSPYCVPHHFTQRKNCIRCHQTFQREFEAHNRQSVFQCLCQCRHCGCAREAIGSLKRLVKNVRSCPVYKDMHNTLHLAAQSHVTHVSKMCLCLQSLKLINVDCGDLYNVMSC